jgi:hypothetical protein
VDKGPCSALEGGHRGYLIGQGCILKSRRADSNRFPNLITSDRSRVAEACLGLQIPHF